MKRSSNPRFFLICDRRYRRAITKIVPIVLKMIPMTIRSQPLLRSSPDGGVLRVRLDAAIVNKVETSGFETIVLISNQADQPQGI